MCLSVFYNKHFSLLMAFQMSKHVAQNYTHLVLLTIYEINYFNSVGKKPLCSFGYWLDGPEIESRWGRDFPHLSKPALGPIDPPVQWVPGLSRGVKSGRGVTLTPHPF
jgi:hypothetical protein